MNEVEEIKDRLNIVEFIGQYVELKKAGANYKANCPFHNERTASMMVSAEKQIFKCFGCGVGGDIFEFLMKIEGLNFPEALELLATRAGVKLKAQVQNRDFKKEQDIKSALYKINKTSSLAFNKILSEHKYGESAREYLKKRKIKPETIKKFLIGYAPKKRFLDEFLYKRGFKPDQLAASGSPNKYYDRVMFPIFDVLGNVVGFTGRALEKGAEPKYLNTYETAIFHKSKILYGLNFAKQAIRQSKLVIVMEGQMDVVLSAQSGVENVIATSGTALTSDHFKIISRYTDDVSFCFDNDEAGFNAAKKAIMMAYEANLNPFITKIPDDFKDVGEIVEKDESIWQEVSKIKTPALEWLIDKIFLQSVEEGTAKKKEVAKLIVPYLVKISDPIEKRFYIKLLSGRLAVNERQIEELLEGKDDKVEVAEDKKKKIKKRTVEELFLQILLARPSLAKVGVSNIKPEELGKGNTLVSLVYSEFYKWYNEQDPKTDWDFQKLEIFLSKKLATKDVSEVKFLVMDASDKYGTVNDDKLKEELLDYISKIKSTKNRELKDQYANLIAQAEANRDIERVKELMKKFQDELRGQIHND